ncbi:PREDICTED: uncharacterized protein LOC106748538 [Dinoponera quadriceps]|uniref:Uncharacterized protein LOC106748538 n=1 Tax=Dinoponera quadriceps TaxID=609295 RepID=A0A6P3XVW4_DINQU|nr:PREDICTED: uncharacterized protein LOC106748538 [Dinoponera quadriceps]
MEQLNDPLINNNKSDTPCKNNRKSQSTDEEISLKYFSDFDSPMKSFNSSTESKTNKPESKNPRKTSSIKRSLTEALLKIDKVNENIRKFISDTKHETQHAYQSKSEEQKENGNEEIAFDAVNSSKRSVKRMISFEYGATGSDDEIENADILKEIVLDTHKTIFPTEKKESEKNIVTSQPPRQGECDQCAYIETNYLALYTKLKMAIAKLKEKRHIICKNESTIEHLNKKIEELTSEITTLRMAEFEVRDMNLKNRILGKELQEFRRLITEIGKEYKQKLTNYYEQVIMHEKEKIANEKDKIMLKLEQRNIEMLKNIEINQKELTYVTKQLELIHKEYFSFKKQMFERRLDDQYEKTKISIEKIKYFYEITLNTMTAIKATFEQILGNDMHMMETLQFWQDNINFLNNELKDCQELYTQINIQLKNKEFINRSNDIPWMEYKAPIHSTTTLSIFVNDMLVDFYNKLIEKWSLDISSISPDMLSSKYKPLKHEYYKTNVSSDDQTAVHEATNKPVVRGIVPETSVLQTERDSPIDFTCFETLHLSLESNEDDISKVSFTDYETQKIPVELPESFLDFLDNNANYSECEEAEKTLIKYDEQQDINQFYKLVHSTPQNTTISNDDKMFWKQKKRGKSMTE